MNYMKAIEEAVKITDDINARYDAFATPRLPSSTMPSSSPWGMSIPGLHRHPSDYWEASTLPPASPTSV